METDDYRVTICLSRVLTPSEARGSHGQPVTPLLCQTAYRQRDLQSRSLQGRGNDSGSLALSLAAETVHMRGCTMASRLSDYGYIYAIGMEGSPLVKIGVRTTPYACVWVLCKRSSPQALELLQEIRVASPLLVEHWLHRRLAPYCDHGEWFTDR